MRGPFLGSEATVSLTAKQSAFVREYAIDNNPSKAAERAGLNADYGRQLLTKPHIHDAIAELQEEARSNTVLTLSELQEWWSNLVTGQDPDARTTDRLKASELLGKSQGAFTDKVEQTGGMRIEVVYADE